MVGDYSVSSATRKIGRKLIVQYPDPSLALIAETVTDFTTIAELVMHMRCAMIEHSGIGIAANQIGDPRAVCVVKSEVMVNPVITQFSGEPVEQYEGCLSLDGKGVFPRPAYPRVLVEYQNIRGKVITDTFYGMDARIVQHEIRHLNGLLVNEGFEDA